MKTRGTGVVGYNVQVAVDAKHHLIVAHEVTNNGIDRDQLTSMAMLARTEMGVDKLTAVADKGYYKSEEILACHEAGITALVPKTKTSGARSTAASAKKILSTTLRKTSIDVRRASVSYGTTGQLSVA
jgi:hypothetical protein